ncbi:MAG: PqqD family protein [Candidatus Cryptobacteroides sp.]
MKIKEGFRLREICGTFVVVPEGIELVNFNKMLSLNESAAYLWKEVEGKDFDVDVLSRLLLEQYEVEEEVARKDAETLLSKWIESGVVIE